ncbi:hypothetical protein [Saccharopolyspora hattusasensis]|uniref:hypothetical protein n=1 Tax=Saccharopolyspora hattusasensis TaxID=1128679 RepID=UPI003D98A6B0
MSWNPVLWLAAEHLAMAAQPSRHRAQRLRALGLVLPTIVEGGYQAAAARALPNLLMAALIFTISVLVTTLIAVIEHYQIHAAAQRHVGSVACVGSKPTGGLSAGGMEPGALGAFKVGGAGSGEILENSTVLNRVV